MKYSLKWLLFKLLIRLLKGISQKILNFTQNFMFNVVTNWQLLFILKKKKNIASTEKFMKYTQMINHLFPIKISSS